MEALFILDQKIFFLIRNFTDVLSIPDLVTLFFAEYMAYLLPVFFAILLLAKTDYSRAKKTAIFIVVFVSSFFARYLVGGVTRYFYHRSRPFVALELVPLFNELSYSFPSGHASFFFTFSFCIFWFNRKWGVWFYVASFLMGIARIASGVHYPSDILGGIIVGTLIGYLFCRYLWHYIDRAVGRFIEKKILSSN